MPPTCTCENLSLRDRKQSLHYGSPLPVAGPFPRVPELPTFWEFVLFVLETASDPSARHDEHWAPAADHCPVCSVRFENVVKFERLQEGEEEGLERALGIWGKLGGR